ncbi:hypothetical protein [Mycoplasmopsis bovis]|uniref:hypothetical protein n=1 Tax=Mycoplasmopsis bovis TaxID=28903 RepID=UPI003D2CCF46
MKTYKLKDILAKSATYPYFISLYGLFTRVRACNSVCLVIVLFKYIFFNLGASKPEATYQQQLIYLFQNLF